jgi:NADH-quinone oxidoreductase subunit L
MLIGTVAITGVGIPGFKLFGAPFGTAGFVSKDMVLEMAFAAGEAGRAFGYFAFTLGIIAATFTAFYSWRLICLTFWGKTRAPDHVVKHPHEVPNTMLLPLAPLAVGALVAGILFYPYFVGKKSDEFWNGALYKAGAYEASLTGADALNYAEREALHADDGHSDEHAGDKIANNFAKPDAHGADAAHAEDGHGAEGEHGEGHHEFPTWVLWAPLIAMLLGSGSAILHYQRGDPLRPGFLKEGGMIYAFLKNKWYFDEIYDFIFMKPALAIGRFLWKEGDGKTIDAIGPDGIAAAVATGARRIVKLQTGYMYHYAFAMLIGIAVFLTFMIMRAGGGQ